MEKNGTLLPMQASVIRMFSGDSGKFVSRLYVDANDFLNVGLWPEVNKY